jgi:phosphoenolpyruvate carboxylase
VVEKLYFNIDGSFSTIEIYDRYHLTYIGYNSATELQNDMNVIYESLLYNEGKAQARSQIQDMHILVDTFRLHVTAIDFRQTSEKNSLAVKEFLTVSGHPLADALAKMNEADKIKALVGLIQTQEIELNPWTLNALSRTSRDTFETLVIFADAARVDSKVNTFVCWKLTLLRL